MDTLGSSQSVEDLCDSEQCLFHKDQLYKVYSTGTRTCNDLRNSTYHEFAFSGRCEPLTSDLPQNQGRHHSGELFPLDETDEVETAIRKWKSQGGRVTFTCEVCKTVFFNRIGLTIHTSKIHPEVRPHECKVCKEMFYTKYDLDAHMSDHKYECRMCEEIFYTQYDFHTHMKDHMRKESFKQDRAGYECPFCEKIYVRKFHLLRHQRTHYPENLQLDEIGKVETTGRNWKESRGKSWHYMGNM